MSAFARLQPDTLIRARALESCGLEEVFALKLIRKQCALAYPHSTPHLMRTHGTAYLRNYLFMDSTSLCAMCFLSTTHLLA
eukprot:1362632-Pleurochrysis_carterae.AAC.1